MIINGINGINDINGFNGINDINGFNDPLENTSFPLAGGRTVFCVAVRFFFSKRLPIGRDL